jgi:hypothetical protein
MFDDEDVEDFQPLDDEIARLEAIAYMPNHTLDDVPAILAAQEALKELL